MPGTSNLALEPTANSVRCAPAVGGGSPRAFDASPAEIYEQANSLTGSIELFLRGDVALSTRNPQGFDNSSGVLLVTRKDVITVAKDDVLAAWAILENLAVSFDQIGAVLGGAKDPIGSSEQQGMLPGALATYLTPVLVQHINEARIRLGQYISDEEAEELTEHIAYWDYATLPTEQE